LYATGGGKSQKTSLKLHIWRSKMEAKMPENRQTDEQRIISVFSILEWAEAFIVDRKARGLSPILSFFYRNKLKKFIQFCELNQVHDIQELNAKHYQGILVMAGRQRS